MKRIDSNCGNEGSIDRAISLKRKNLRIQLEMDWINIDSGGGEVKRTSIKDGHLDRKETARLPRLFLFFYLILLASNVDHVEGLPVRPRSSNFNFRHPFPGGCCCCSLGLTSSYSVLPNYICVLPCFTGFHWILPRFNRFYLVFLDFTYVF